MNRSAVVYVRAATIGGGSSSSSGSSGRCCRHSCNVCAEACDAVLNRLRLPTTRGAARPAPPAAADGAVRCERGRCRLLHRLLLLLLLLLRSRCRCYCRWRRGRCRANSQQSAGGRTAAGRKLFAVCRLLHGTRIPISADNTLGADHPTDTTAAATSVRPPPDRNAPRPSERSRRWGRGKARRSRSRKPVAATVRR